MERCPFCDGQVEESLIINGGPCPICLNEIPGEETATDPGAAQQAETAAAEQAAQKSRTRLMSVVGVFALIGVGVGTWFGTRPPPELPPLITEVGFTMRHVDFHWDKEPPPPPPEVIVKVDRPQLTNSGKAPSVGGQVVEEAPPGSVAGVGSPEAGPEDTPGSKGPNLFDDPLARSAGPKSRGPRGIVLKDRGEIQAMVTKVLHRYAKNVMACETQRSSTAPDSWHVSLWIAESGTPYEIEVNPMGKSDPGLETCLDKTINTWKFARVERAFNITQVYDFGT